MQESIYMGFTDAERRTSTDHVYDEPSKHVDWQLFDTTYDKAHSKLKELLHPKHELDGVKAYAEAQEN